MPAYKCFKCGKKVTNTVLEKRFVCNECGSKIFYKPRSQIKKIKTD
ncbi:MAG TPA: DNA-directed RNA polymerase subunit P [Candidatus Nanoarchaeia archaeon]|nr:DNA-directed RNA polymerase subunit P [Candidatus Nanoarchaeia archaeon]